MSKKGVVLAVVCAAALGAAASWAGFTRPWEGAAPRAGAPPSSEFPGGHPLDAAQVTTGRLAMERMPSEVTGALELHSVEIVKTVEQLAGKQQRITGACPPGAAIRVVAEDGTVVCQRFPKGVVSVAAAAGVPRNAATQTTQGAVPGGIGRYQLAGDDDFLVVPVSLPDGAIVTGFSYTFYDADERADSAAYLYRTDDALVAAVKTSGARAEIRFAETDAVEQRKVDNSAYGYFVYFQLSREAGANLMPVSAAVSYRLP